MTLAISLTFLFLAVIFPQRKKQFKGGLGFPCRLRHALDNCQQPPSLHTARATVATEPPKAGRPKAGEAATLFRTVVFRPAETPIAKVFTAFTLRLVKVTERAFPADRPGVVAAARITVICADAAFFRSTPASSLFLSLSPRTDSHPTSLMRWRKLLQQ